MTTKLAKIFLFLLFVLSFSRSGLALADEYKLQNKPNYHKRSALIADWRALSLKDENGRISPDALIKGAQHKQAIIDASHAHPFSHKAGTSPTSWTELGPNNIGGAIRSLAINPKNADQIWIGTAGGGIWTTTNATTLAKWTPVNDKLPKLVYTSIAVNPSDPNILYAGTGVCNSNLSSDSITGVGILKSVDNGKTWALLQATVPDPNDAVTSWSCVNKVVINPNNTSVLLSANQGPFSNVGGLMRSSDGGETWTNTTLPTSSSNGQSLGPVISAMDVAIDPNNVNRALIGGNQGDVAYSVDGGITWNIVSLTTGAQSVKLAYSKSTPNLVYASVDKNNGEIYASTDGGITWTFKSNSKHLSQGFNANAIWADPVNKNRVVVAGMDIFISTDAGSTSSAISTWYYQPASPHADHHDLISDPNYNGTTNLRVYDINDGGVYVTSNISKANANDTNNSWTFLNNGLGVTQFYSGAGRTGGKLIGGAQDNGSLIYSGSNNAWNNIYGGDGGFSAVDSADPNYLYGEYVYTEIFQLNNGGAGASNGASALGDPAAKSICQGIADGGKGCGGNEQSNFISPFIIDPNNNNRILAGGASLWVSNNIKNATPTWAAIKPPSTITGNPISSIAVAQGNSNIIWVGHNNGEIYRTSNGTSSSPTWTMVSSSMTPARYNTRIFIVPGTPNVVYATFGGFSAGNVLRTADNGASWYSISSGLPKVPMRSITANPTNPSWLYLGSEIGIFTSEDGGLTWSTSNEGPATVSVDELFWLDNTTLAAATYGRGMFKTSIITAVAPSVPSAPTIGVATPSNASADVSFTTSGDGQASSFYTVTSAPGNITATGYNSPITVPGLNNGTSYTFTVTATNSSGSGPASSQSNAVVPTTTTPSAPSVPTIASVSQSMGASYLTSSAIVKINPSVFSGGSPISGYTVTTSPYGLDTDAGSLKLTHTINYLINASSTFSVTATNAIGTSQASSAVSATNQASDSSAVVSTVTPKAAQSAFSYTSLVSPSSADSSSLSSAPPIPGTSVPQPPTVGTAINAGLSSAKLHFTAPTLTGGSPILYYIVTAYPDVNEAENTLPPLKAQGPASPIKVDGLKFGTSYTFSVVAVNAVGPSDPSDLSNAVDNLAPPSAPEQPSAVFGTPGNTKTTVGFMPGNSNNSPITRYTVTANSTDKVAVTATGTSSPIIVTGLTNGVAYTFTVVATNAVGDGEPSAPSEAVTPSSTVPPGLPVDLVVGNNLIGNSSAPMDVTSVFGDPNKVDSVWRWLSDSQSWAYYSPVPANMATAAINGYPSFSAVNSGESIWVKAKSAFTAVLPQGDETLAIAFQQNEMSDGLPSGWSFISITDNDVTNPQAFNIKVGDPSFNIDADSATNITSLWSWNPSSSKWYYYAPDKYYAGTLAQTISDSGYLDFTTTGQKLNAGIGFWVCNDPCTGTTPPIPDLNLQDTASTSTTIAINAPPAITTANDFNLADNGASTDIVIKDLSVSVAKGWNLLGNGIVQTYTASTPVASLFGDSNKVTSVWKWNSDSRSWAFYSPTLTTLDLALYASQNGYEVLSLINAGDGFWVNAKAAFTYSLPGGFGITSDSYGPDGVNALNSSWNMISIGDSKSIKDFNAAQTPISMISMWAWDSATGNWQFYAPSLDTNGTLNTYLQSQGFEAFNSTVAPSVGFWVNVP